MPLPLVCLDSFLLFVDQPDARLYPSHIPISGLERTVLTVGSAMAALNNPLRGGKSPPPCSTSSHLTRF